MWFPLQTYDPTSAPQTGDVLSEEFQQALTGCVGLWMPAIDDRGKALDFNPTPTKNIGALNGGITTTPMTGRSLATGWKFDGTSGYWQIANTGLIAGTDWTISALVNIPSGASSSGSGRAIYCERAPTGNDIIKLDCLNSGLSYPTSWALILRNDAGTLMEATGSSTINDGITRLLTVTKSGSSIFLYINDSLDHVGYVWSGTDNYTDSLQTRIGGDAGDSASHFFGMAAEVAVWKIALTAAQVSSLYSALLTGEPFPLFQPQRAAMMMGSAAAPAGGGLLLRRRRAAA